MGKLVITLFQHFWWLILRSHSLHQKKSFWLLSEGGKKLRMGLIELFILLIVVHLPWNVLLLAIDSFRLMGGEATCDLTDHYHSGSSSTISSKVIILRPCLHSDVIESRLPSLFSLQQIVVKNWASSKGSPQFIGDFLAFHNIGGQKIFILWQRSSWQCQDLWCRFCLVVYLWL